MIKKRNPKCQFCKSFMTIKRGSQRGLKRYFCKNCKQYFSINHKIKPVLWTAHIDGVPYRKLASLYNISQAKAYRQVEAEMDQLPDYNGPIKLGNCIRRHCRQTSDLI